MINKFITKAYNNYFDFRSVKTNRKIVVIESDDWGSYRTRDINTLEKLNKINPDIVKDPYSQLDSMATAEDLSALFEILNSVKDKYGNPACVTANTCMANPDFEKIKASDYEKFFYIPFYETVQENGGKELWELWETGVNQGFLKPQLHGREHLHSLQWLEELKAGNKDLLKAFDLESFGIPYMPLLSKRRKNLQAALDHYGLEGEEKFQENWFKQSAIIFEKTFGYSSETFIPTAYIWHSRLDEVLNKLNIRAYQGIKLQYQPYKNTYKRIPHFIGQSNNGLKYLVRNVFFEPSLEPEKDWFSKTLSGIKEAFYKQQPAIIGSHRINYIGSLNEQNRYQTLYLLKKILHKVVTAYPEVEFLSSNNLLKLTQ